MKFRDTVNWKHSFWHSQKDTNLFGIIVYKAITF